MFKILQNKSDKWEKVTKIKQSKILTCDFVSAWNREERVEKAEDDAEEATIWSLTFWWERGYWTRMLNEMGLNDEGEREKKWEGKGKKEQKQRERERERKENIFLMRRRESLIIKKKN